MKARHRNDMGKVALRSLVPQWAFLVLGVTAGHFSVLANAASGADSHSNQVTTSAQRSFEDQEFRKLATQGNVARLANGSTPRPWFQGFRGSVEETLKGLKPIQRNLPIAKGGSEHLSVAANALPGDVIVVEWTQSAARLSKLLVYVGEESFPNSTRKRSFFIYPYRTRLEYNTVPARQHLQYLSQVLNRETAALQKNHKFTAADSRHGGTQWLQRSKKGESIYIKTGMRNGTGSYSVFRPSDISDQFVTLQRRLPFQRQVSTESCFFVSYAEVATYKNARTDDASDADVSRYQQALIREEVWEPASERQKIASALFRQMLFDSDINRQRWTTPNDPALIRDLRNEKWLNHWLQGVYAEREVAYNLKEVASPEVAKGDMLNTIREYVGRDDPLMVTIMFGDVRTIGNWKNIQAVELEKTAGSVGHWIVVTGVRQEGDQAWIHFTTTFRNDLEGNFCVKFGNLYDSLPRASLRPRSLRIPKAWTGWTRAGGEALPAGIDDPSMTMPIPVICALAGAPLAVQRGAGK